MTRLTWDAPGERFYETGADRGVLYVGSNVGVAWPGLISVAESPTGGEARPYYIDGVKYLNLSSNEEFEATISAFSSPKEFGVCDGEASIQNGLFVTQQPRKAFNFSYRTLIGNDTEGKKHGYKIHLVYNALAGPSSRTNSTVASEVEPNTLAWPITTLPPSLTGRRPTAHFVIDSRSTPDGLLKAIEDILYGSAAAQPRIPLVSELVTMFQSEGPVLRTNLKPNPAVLGPTTPIEIRRNLVLNPGYRSYSASAEMRRNYIADPRLVTASGWTGVSAGGSVTGAAAYSPAQAASANSIWGVSVEITAPAGAAVTGSVSAAPTLGGSFSGTRVPTNFNIPAGTTQRVFNAFTIPASGIDGLRALVAFTSAFAGAKVDKFLMELSTPHALPYFDGSTPAAEGLTYSWLGTANASASIASGLVTDPTSHKAYLRKGWTIVGGATDGTNTTRSYINAHSITLITFSVDAPPAAAGDVVSGRYRARVVNSPNDVTMIPHIYTYAGSAVGSSGSPGTITLPKSGAWVDVVIDNKTILATGTSARFYTTITSPMANAEGAIFEISNSLIEKSIKSGPWFDGASASDEDITCSWAGAAFSTASVMTGKKPKWFDGTVYQKTINGKKWAAIGPSATYAYASAPASAGKYYAARFLLTGPPGDLFGINTTDYVAGAWGKIVGPTTQTIPESGEIIVEIESTVATPPNTVRVYFGPTPTVAEKRRDLRFTDILVEEVSGPGERVKGPYFDGSTPDEDKRFYSWAGAINDSASVLNTWHLN